MSNLFNGSSNGIYSIISKISISLAAWLLAPSIVCAAINIDGRLDEPDWENAKTFNDFVVIDPLTLETPQLPTKTLMLSTPEGLAIAFICEQPPDKPRTRNITKRDATSFDADSVSVMIDFNGSGEAAYEFSVSVTGSYRDGAITNEKSTSYDWDGIWQRAVYEEPERWNVEILIPWSIVAMRQRDDDIRHLGISFQRKLQSTNETFAFPDASTNRPRFISDFAKVEVTQYSAKKFYIVPHVTLLSDLLNNTITGKTGADLFLADNGRFQLAATINPDFGQVESDDLVINFSTIESVFSDKRPFFTENQSIFDGFIPKNNRIFYTRRIGGANDKDGSPSEIEGALKIIGSTGSISYGGFAAQEAGEAGRSYYAGRVIIPTKNWSLGTESTYVKRPFLDRTAFVNSLDYDLKINNNLQFHGVFMGSNIKAKAGNSNGFGSFNAIRQTINAQWSYEVSLLQFSNTFDVSDMGYLQRNSLAEYYLSALYRQPKDSLPSRSASVTWSGTLILPWNDDGLRLPGTISLTRTEKMQSGADMGLSLQFATNGYDDLISRNNGLVWLNERWNLSASYNMPREGAWRTSLKLSLFQEGYKDWAIGFDGGITWYPDEKFNLDFKLSPKWSRDWLIWMQGNQLGSFSQRQVTAGITANWFPAEGHEVLFRSQWITINADNGQAYLIGDDSMLAPSSDPLYNFAKINFGIQLRYCYEIAPMSNIYAVYSRGGLDRIDNPTQSTLGLITESSNLRKSDQFMIKVQYRF
jgi:hypothetical protein